MRKLIILLAFFSGVILKAQTSNSPVIESWITTADRSELFSHSEKPITFSTDGRRGRYGPSIIVDEGMKMQEVSGFGFALTGGSAELMMGMDPAERKKLIDEIFRTDGNNIGVSYLRVSLGSSDLNSFVFSYNDLKDGETDMELIKFSLSQDLRDVVPVLKEILEVNPDIKILASPWSAPTWMKNNNKVKGGNLKKEYFDVYARYFVKYIQAMEAQGIKIDAVTVQNEPLNSNNTPSMPMSASDQKQFVKENLGPAFARASLNTRIIIFDHNLDRIDYPLTILNDPEAAKFVDGTGFHHYGGEFSAMSLMHAAHPEKNLYFTEQMVIEQPGSPTIEIAAQVKRLIIGAMQNWSKNVVLWNLAADSLNDPHTDDGGCPMCQGALTIDKNRVSRNLAYYTIAHASKFVRPGSVRIYSSQKGDKAVSLTEDEENRGKDALRVAVTENFDILPNVAFKTPGGKTVLIVVNDSFGLKSFRIQYNGQYANIRLSPGAVGTYVW